MAAKIIRLNFGNSGNTAPVLSEEEAYADSDVLGVDVPSLSRHSKEKEKDESTAESDGSNYEVKLSMSFSNLDCLRWLLRDLADEYREKSSELLSELDEEGTDYDRTVDIYLETEGCHEYIDILDAAADAIVEQLGIDES